MSEAAAKLSEIAKTGSVDGFGAQFKVLVDACGECHREYRSRSPS